ncbi:MULTISPECIES: TrmB family transcriptional regulator [Virgibacillus]|uniref:Sugar-specific transcriptional regulator TrmB n=2 Tax=Virgibacillus TaxID=84406 RepID=A0A024Q6S5_9BACI|nr:MULTISPECIES: TrmB family transcriptional regulator [Virgibacillus]EQB38575.1 TrmB family transcriptional regulator [Virgibacillus sp. CM-4]GGJ55850.1 transcriptional regulator [Virgibacillus kapii]CDQ37915.1 Sugar-specific transcriptional regulator TrmB [Virgibacillus massiliensis]
MLQKFGFSQYESNVFETLASSDEPMDATQIVKYSGVPKAKVYEVLTRMIDKGMVMDSISEKKKLYTALPLPLAIEKLTAEFQENIKQLKTSSKKKPFLDDRIWSLKVNTSIQAQMKQLIQEAKETIRVSLWKDDLVEYLPLLKEKEKNGVEVEVLVVGNMNTNLTHVHTLIPAKEHDVLERFRLIIVDDRETIFAGVENDSWQAMKTMSKPFVKLFIEFFYHDVALAKINEKHSELLMNDQDIKHILMKLRY